MNLPSPSSPSPRTSRRLAFEKWLSLVGSSAILTGCSALTPHTALDLAYPNAPSTWLNGRENSASDERSLEAWWKAFDDTLLESLVADALRLNPDIASGLAKIDEAQARAGFEHSGLFPTISLNASGQRTRTSPRGNKSTSQATLFRGTADASWTPDLFGEQGLQISAANADLARSRDDFRRVQASLAAEVASAYVALRQAENQLAIVQTRVEAQEDTVQIARWREAAGFGSALDTQQAISVMEQARSSIPALLQTTTEMENRLSLLSGKQPGELRSLLAEPAPVPRVGAMLPLGIPTEALHRRPDVRAARNAVAAADLRRSAAERQRLPSLTLSGSIGLETTRSSRFLSPETSIASIVGGLAAPLLDAGRIRASIGIQTAIEKQAWATYESTILTALAEVENALLAVHHTTERYAIVERGSAAARYAARLATQRYEAGQVDLLVVLEAQRTLFSLEEQEVITRADQAQAHIQLYQALGGGWST